MMTTVQDFSAETPDTAAVWSRLSYKQKNRALYERQVALLRLFLEKGAIGREQYEKSLRDLTANMRL